MSSSESDVTVAISRAEFGATTGMGVFARGGAANPVNLADEFSDWAPDTGSYQLTFVAGTGE